MAKLIKVTNNYWDDNAEPSYSPFSYKQITNVIGDYTEDDASADEYKNMVRGVVGSRIDFELEYRDWDDPSGHTIEIVDAVEEIKRLTAHLSANIRMIEDIAAESAE